MRALSLPKILENDYQFELGDDFFGIDGNVWSSVVTPTLTSGNNRPGSWSSQVGTNDNDQIALYHKGQPGVLLAGYPITMRARIAHYNSSLDALDNIFIGIATESPSAFSGLLANNGAGLIAAGSGHRFFGFYKVDGGTKWSLVSRLGTTTEIITTTDEAVNYTGGPVTFEVTITPRSLSNVEVTFGIDQLGRNNTKQVLASYAVGGQLPTPVTHRLDASSFGNSPLKSVIYAKQGSANPLTVLVDRIVLAQTRY